MRCSSTLLLCLSAALIGSVSGGCFQHRLCCTGRNMSCEAVEDGVRFVKFDSSQTSSTTSDGERDLVRFTPTAGGPLTEELSAGAAYVEAAASGAEQTRPITDDDDDDDDWRAFVSTVSPPTRGSSRMARLEASTRASAPYGSPIEIPIEWAETTLNGFEGSGETPPATLPDTTTSPATEVSSTTQTPPAAAGPPFETRFSIAPATKSAKTTTSARKVEYRVLFGQTSGPTDPREHAKYQYNQPIIKYKIVNDNIPMQVRKFGRLQLKPGDNRCFCDEVCTRIGDCCSDYQYICPPTDCELSQWSGWSECERRDAAVDDNSFCGPGGVRSRARTVLRPRKNGGRACDVLYEEVACYKACFQYEPALLLDYEYGPARVPGYENRSHIYYDLPKQKARLLAMPTYCLRFVTDWLSAECLSKDVRAELSAGNDVCVECQPTAQLNRGTSCVGEGSADGERGFWHMTRHVGCTGRWMRTRVVNPCRCDTAFPTLPRFIMV